MLRDNLFTGMQINIFFLIFIKQIYLSILHEDCSFPTFFSFHSLLLPLLNPTLPTHSHSKFTPLFLFRKGKASDGYQQSMTYQDEVRLSSYPCFKAGQGNTVGGTSFQKPAKALGTTPAPTARSPIIRQSYTIVTRM